MLKLLLFSVVCLYIQFVASWRGLMLGPGRWLVLNVMPCDNPEQCEFTTDIVRKKINRTHDCFDISVDVNSVVNNSYAIKIDVYQLVDGGFKYYQTITDDCACAFLKRHAEDNVKRALNLANVDPPDCPIQPAKIDIKNFVMDYRELPRHGVYGTFEAIVTFTYEEKVVFCVKVVLNFDQRDSEDSDEEDIDYDLV